MSSTEFNYYEILEISKEAGKDEIKKAYRKLAMKYHPDRNKGCKDAEKKFKKVNEAYSCLSDDSKRKQYDMFGKTGGSGFGAGGGFGGGAGGVDLNDIFEQFFGGQGGGFSGGGARKKTGVFAGENIEKFIEVDLKTSIFGGKKEIEIEKMVSCSDCKGEGGTGKKTCEQCKGSGYVTYRQQSLFGVIEQTGACDKCNGEGQKIENICKKCDGKRRIKISKKIEIDIPAGIDDGMVIKIEGEGNEGVGTTLKGDLYIKFKVPLIEKNIRRRGVNLYYDLEIEVVEAILGTKKEINFPIIGKREIEIPSGTSHGTIIKKTGDGVKYIDKDKKGDLIINILIKIPKKLSVREKELYLEIAQEKKLDVNNKKGIFEKIFG